MNKIEVLKLALNEHTVVKDNFIQHLIDFEIKEGYPNSTIREKIIGPLCDLLFTGENFSKELSNGLKINFTYNSKIAREFLLSSPKKPNHVWEPQTTKLLLHFSLNSRVVIFAGAYFGDQVIPIAHQIKTKGTCYAFEPNLNNSNLINKNALLNNLNNIIVNNIALWNKSNVFLEFEGEDALASTIEKNIETKESLKTITIDDYVKEQNVKELNLLMIDVEGSEFKVLQGAIQTIKENKPIIIFETHSLYDDWSSGLENSPSVALLKNLGYFIFAIREFHQNIDTSNMFIELLPLDRTYCKTPPHHGFNLLAVPSLDLIENDLFKIVTDLSPKLILHKNDKLFNPTIF